MALTQPFFNGIKAFDAMSDGTIRINVLGGDAITQINYSIYENDTGNLVLSSLKPVSGDITSQTIRTFDLTIPANTLQNNYTYKISATTQNNAETSSASEYQLFSCYVQPSYSIMRYNGSNMVAFTNSYVVPSSTLTLYLGYLRNDAGSSSLLREGSATLYGVTQLGSEAVISSQPIFGADVGIGAPTATTDYSIKLSGFAPTQDSGGVPLTDAEFTSYNLKIEGETTYGMAYSTSVNGISCYYSTSSSGQTLALTNQCSDGSILIQINYTDDPSSIYSYALQFKEDADNTWITFSGSEDGSEAYAFNPTGYLNFYYCAANKVYDFRLLLFDSNGGVISSYVATILSNFKKSFVCDSNISYNITAEWQVGSISLSNENVEYAPFNSKYPIAFKNTLQSYHRGQYTAILLAPTSLTSSEVDRVAQTRLQEQFAKWLSNGEVKIIKSLNGDIYLAYISDAISNSYYKELANGLASATFSWTEVGDIKTDLVKLGLVNSTIIN